MKYPLFGLLGPRGVEPESSWPEGITPIDLVGKVKEAKAYLKQVRGDQPSRLIQLLSMLDTKMWIYFGLRIFTEMLQAPVTFYEKGLTPIRLSLLRTLLKPPHSLPASHMDAPTCFLQFTWFKF